ncbi:MAG TPA: Vms1/Ankzf1 family peptidyl-tRNA hydrolase [Jatrophihabitans sp.]|nr:Vms1/Ankzf1 family peptidyl-tRNA hydrolase [Jatrophihabitans sp.]
MSAITGPAPALDAGPDQSPERELARPFERVAFLYANPDPADPEAHTLRWRALAAMLRSDGAPEPAIAALGVRYAAAMQQPATLAVFAAADGEIVHERRLVGSGLSDVAGYAAPAPIVPLLVGGQQRPPYLLVVADRTGADLAGSRGADHPVQAWTVSGPDDEIERNAPGGWSQLRYQHRAEDSWKHNAKQVAAAVLARLTQLDAEVLVLSGDVRALQFLRDALPADLDVLVAHIHGSRGADGSQPHRPEAVARVLRDAADSQTALLLQRFHEHLDQRGLAVEGRAATLAALAAGRVATLFVTDPPDLFARAWFGPGTTEVYPDRHATVGASPQTRLGMLADVAVRAALLAGAHVRVVPAGTPGAPVDGIGALCRYGSPG